MTLKAICVGNRYWGLMSYLSAKSASTLVWNPGPTGHKTLTLPFRIWAPCTPIPTDNSSSSFLSKYIISKIKIDIWWYKRNVAIWGKLPMLLIWRGKTVIRIISSLKVPVLERLMNLTWNKSTNTYVFIHLFMNWFSFVFLQSVAVNWSNHWMMKESWIVIVPMHARKSSIP